MLKSQLKRKFDKKGYHPGASNLKIYIWYIVNLTLVRSGVIPFSNVIVVLLKIFGAKIGNEVRIKPGINIRYPWKLTIGDNSWLADCYIDNLDMVTIGNNVCISQQAMLLTGNHNYKIVSFDLITKPIILKDGVWIGARAVVCPGIIANTHSILTVGSIATKTLQAYTINQGNPAINVKNRSVFNI
jgi:putative colanic acid biosynthesis acetyltransferase WcaF